MPHENPNLAATEPANLNSRRTSGAKDYLADKKESDKIMAATNKENNVRVTSTSIPKVSIPEHIHDVSAKTFYKLGIFLGKVRNLYLNLALNCFLIFRAGLLHAIKYHLRRLASNMPLKLFPNCPLQNLNRKIR